VGPTGTSYDYSFQFFGGVIPPDNLSSPGDGLGAIIFTEIPGTVPFVTVGASQFITSGFDYAEYFEWEDGNTCKEDRFGYFVGLGTERTHTIKVASSAEEVIGVTSKTAGMIHDAGGIHWSGAITRDELLGPKTTFSYKSKLIPYIKKECLGTRYISLLKEFPDEKNILHKFVDLGPLPDKLREEILNLEPQECIVSNPAYNPQRPYVPRSRRSEWIPVGLMGKIAVRDDGSCIPGGSCDCRKGIATKGQKWKILRRISHHTVLILFK
jgi:hypothetical protein